MEQTTTTPLVAYSTKTMPEPYVLNPKIFNNFDEKKPSIADNDLIIGFLNVKSGFLDGNLKKQKPLRTDLLSPMRTQAIPQILTKRRIDVLTFCEMAPKQLSQLSKILDSKYKIVGFCTGRLNEDFNISTNDILERYNNGINDFTGEILGFIYDSTKISLTDEKNNCVYAKLPNGQKHSRIYVTAHFNLKETNKKISITTFHFDHLSKESREKSCEIVNEQIHNETKKSFDLVVACGDGNLFEDQDGSKLATILYKNNVMDPRYTSKYGHYGQEGTIMGGVCWDEKFNPKVIEDDETKIKYFNSNCIDVFCYTSKSFVPKYTMNYPAFMNEKLKLIDSCIVPQGDGETELRKNPASDHFTVITAFENIILNK
jgi:hypothetical protein